MKHATDHFYRLFIRALPLLIAALMIAAQMLVTFHSTAHANQKPFAASAASAASAERAGAQGATTSASAPTSTIDTHTKFWDALFGHAADGADNAAACVAWDAAFAATALIDGTEQLSATVHYSVAILPTATEFIALADLPGISLARGPPRT